MKQNTKAADLIGNVEQDDLLVDLGLPSVVKWATRNIDVTQPNGFAASPYQYDCSFCSWGNTKMYNPINELEFDHDFGTLNNSLNDSFNGYKSDSVYGQTEGCKLTEDIDPSHDAARVNLGAPWRMPTTEDFKELFDNCVFITEDGTEVDKSHDDKRAIVNGVRGIYLKSKINGNTVFFACSGYGCGSSWYGRGSNGYYWSSSFNSARFARYLNFNSGGADPQYNVNRHYGFAIRPVQ